MKLKLPENLQKIKVFCDFDGTVAANDVGNQLFRTFADGRCKEYVNLWKAGKISSKECLLRECALTQVTRAQLEEFVATQNLDPYFKKFMQFCQHRGIGVEIVSDGLDFYIERILKNHGLDSSLHFVSNRLIFLGPDRITAQFPYYEKGCGHCGNCKGYHVQKAKKQGYFVIYVGDGFSDRCGARLADVVFAKRELQKFCQENHLAHFSFQNFGEVLEIISDSIA
ncbi:MAG: phosphoserine phosphatase [Calditrichaeota bacterium]|nr:MAG: phosphoserine phosphatase [Calditrichota bacterium]